MHSFADPSTSKCAMQRMTFRILVIPQNVDDWINQEAQEMKQSTPRRSSAAMLKQTGGEFGFG